MAPPSEHEDINADRITVGMKVMGGILIHAVMLVIFFMSLKSDGQKNAEAIIRCENRISQLEADRKSRDASTEAQIALINVRLAVLENQNVQRK